jgi:hypothetical protein
LFAQAVQCAACVRYHSEFRCSTAASLCKRCAGKRSPCSDRGLRVEKINLQLRKAITSRGGPIVNSIKCMLIIAASVTTPGTHRRLFVDFCVLGAHTVWGRIERTAICGPIEHPSIRPIPLFKIRDADLCFGALPPAPAFLCS